MSTPSAPTPSSDARPVRVALDLLGGDHAPEAVLDGALIADDELPDAQLVLVGPPDGVSALLAERGQPADRFEVAAATEVVGMDEDPLRGVRAKKDATVRVAARLVRDGGADAMVSVGSTGASLAAAVFALGRVPGVTRPALAVVVPAAAGPVVLLDAGANVDCTPDQLAQFALAGSAFAQVGLGIDEPRVGLLNVGEEPGKGDGLRREAYDVLAGLPVRFVGNVEGRDVPAGGRADVVVTDGFAGNVLLKGIEGAFAMVAAGVGASGTDVTEALDPFQPERLGGAVLLGIDGVAVVGHGASSPRAIASCVALAVRAVRDGLVPRVSGAIADLVARRRAEAGLPPAVGATS